ncbi:MAG: uroporphyrinogen-III synthase [Alphaproteobacteria bacterium]|jgi:uroporphyrinogen-III synthase|nr:uroporphyrinogen-III synthase [Alphaproteobacteria bacterium]MBP7729842.1 uroporphyrinogen-III synthase [Alphaproteobacteria bacterium]
MTCVLLIRSQEEAYTLAKDIQSKGIESVHHPLFTARFFPIPPLKAPQALIITSKNALRALKGIDDLKNIPLYGVGNQTALFAQQLGFSNVMSASGTSKELLALILKKADPSKGVMYHLSGKIIKGDLVEKLRAAGFKAKRHIVYQIEDYEELPAALLSNLKNHQISHVMFFSPRTTELFVNLLSKYKIEKEACIMTALCVSHSVAEKARLLQWAKIWVSLQPTIQSMAGYFDEEQ